MSNELNLDVNSYNEDDLFNLFSVTNNDNKGAILVKYKEKCETLAKIKNIDFRSKINEFFQNAYRKILTIHESRNKHVEKDKIVPFLENTKVINPVPEINNSFQVKYPKGLINPIEKKTTTEILCLDSVFRDMVHYKESSDFVYELPNPIENVISMKLLSAEIPEIQETISTSTLNNYIEITMYNGWYYDISDNTLKQMPDSGITIPIFIPAGHPPDAILRETIQSQLNSRRDSFSFLELSYDEYKYTLLFRFKTLVECVNWNNLYNQNENFRESTKFPSDDKPPTRIFRMPTVTYSGSNITGTAHEDLKRIYLGKNDSTNINTDKDIYATEPASEKNLKYKINFNPENLPIESSVGWKLGFRNKKNMSTLDSDKEYSTKNVESCKLINREDKTNRFNIIFYGSIAATSPYIGVTDSYYFLYVNDFVGNYNDTLNVAQKKNVFAKSILAKIQLSDSTYNTMFIQSTGVSILEKTREYFGPVTIKKLHIKLINKHNKVVNMKNTDLSLTLQFEKLYSCVS